MRHSSSHQLVHTSLHLTTPHTGHRLNAAANLQIHAIRVLGPSGHAALQPMRLLGTVAGSYVVLREPVRSLYEWIGLGIVIGVLAWYVTVGKR